MQWGVDMTKPIEVDHVKKRSNKVRLEEFFGKSTADKIAECLEECAGAENFGQCIKECLKKKDIDDSTAGDAVTIMGFITVG